MAYITKTIPCNSTLITTRFIGDTPDKSALVEKIMRCELNIFGKCSTQRKLFQDRYDQLTEYYKKLSRIIVQLAVR